MKVRGTFWFVLSLSISTAFAADGVEIRGIVTDLATKNPVAGAEVTAVGSQARAPDATDATGRFDIVLLPEIKNGALIRIRVQKSGYNVHDEKLIASDNALVRIVLERTAAAPTLSPPVRGSDLRLQIEHLSQGIQLLSGQQPRWKGEPVFCDTVKLSLVVAHNGEGKQPVLVNDIGVSAERIAAETASNGVDCAVDTLSSKPFGIQERNAYFLDIAESGRSGRFIESARPGSAFKINPDNLLQRSDRTVDISLVPNETPIGYDIFVEAQAPGLYRVWFTSNYDASGPRTAKTGSFLLGK
jgi:hypothetical protein